MHVNKRLKEIEEKATQNYLDFSEYYLGDWVDECDIEEYAQLTEKDQPIVKEE